MAWQIVSTHTDSETGIVTEKQKNRRAGHGTSHRYVVKMKERIFIFNRHEIMEIADALGEICDLIDEKRL